MCVCSRLITDQHNSKQDDPPGGRKDRRKKGRRETKGGLGRVGGWGHDGLDKDQIFGCRVL